MRTEDGYLISKCLAGEPETFGLLVDKYRSAIYAFAYTRLGNFQDAEDVAQEVFLRAYQKLHTLKGYDSFLAWLYAIASNRCKKQLQARARRLEHQYIEDQEESVLEGPSLGAYRRKAEYEPLYEALAELPELYREVLTLYYLGGMNSREIAQFLGASTATIKSRLQRARELLKEEMNAMMTTTFDEMKLQPSFTFRVVEAVKRTRIHTGPSKTALPFGVSAAVGLIALVLSLMVPHSPLYPIGELIGSALPSQMQVAEKGVIPVEAVDITKITILTSEKEKGDLGQKPKPEPTPMFGGGTWEKKGEMPEPRFLLPQNSSVVNGIIYAIGGRTTGGAFGIDTQLVYAFNPATGIWTKKADMPAPPRSGHATVVVNNKIYVIGGSPTFSDPDLPTVHEYDPAADTWTRKADMLTPRSIFGAAVVDGKIYVMGGFSEFRPYKRVRTVEMYDPTADTWEEVGQMPTFRVDFAAIAVNGKIYALGGGDEKVYDSTTVDEYNPATNTWSKKTDMPIPNSIYGACEVNGKIYIIGGYSGGSHISSVQIYDPATDTWTLGPSLAEARSNLSAAAVNGKIYVFGGQRNLVAIPTVEELDLGLPPGTVSVTPAGKLPTTWGEVKAAQ